MSNQPKLTLIENQGKPAMSRRASIAINTVEWVKPIRSKELKRVGAAGTGCWISDETLFTPSS